MPVVVQNPVVKGFNPDPCVIRVGDDYYLATSTFHYFPGVQIFHSKDLVNWKLIAHPLNETRLINLEGDADSGGVWAPCLSCHDGLFYLIYSDMKTDDSSLYKDCHNYLITATNIQGPWSDPIYLNSSGFDPSIFHDGDKKYILNVVRDHRMSKHWSYGIAMQEFSMQEKKLVGKRQIIFKGSKIGKTEGPNLYKIGNYYYLVTAEGGTEYGHCTTVCRSKNIWGPYELHPNVNGVILSSFGHPENPMQKMGHASFVLGKNNKWYLMHLMSRPLELGRKPILDLASQGHCPLGRETALQEVYFENDWPYVVGGLLGQEKFTIEDMEEVIQEDTWPGRDDFDNETLNINYQSMRVPLTEEMLSLKDRKGHLRLYGHESLASSHKVSFIARRFQSFTFDAKTSVEFFPEYFQQQAGLVCMYDRLNFTFLYITHDEKIGRCISILKRTARTYSEPLDELIAIPDDVKKVHFKVSVDKDYYQYFYSFDYGQNFKKIGPKFKTAELSDDFIFRNCPGRGFFTGAFVGLACIDLVSEHLNADFDYFEYIEK